jgi:molybdate transport repressor ModE-like protein
MEPDRWLGVELRHLAALKAIAEEGTFGRAATRLGYTQSAVSQQIATLERVVGERLLERPGGPRRVSLTEAGRLLLRHADAIVARLEAAHADFAALAAGEAGSLRVGTYQSIGQRVLPLLLRRFAREWPRVELRLTESNTDQELVAMIESGDLDLTFADLPLPDGPFEYVEVLRDPYVLVAPVDADLPADPSLETIADLDLIGFRHCRSLNQLAAAAPEPLRFVFRSDHNGTVQGMVAAGFGVAVVPRLTVDANDERVQLIELDDVPHRMIAVVWHRDRHRSPATRAFVELAQEVCAERAPVRV